MSVYLWTQKWAEGKGLKTWARPNTTSTNEIAKTEGGFELYLADQQTAGKGRGENKWENSQPGSSMMSSWAYELASPPQHVTSPLIGLCLYNSAREAFGELSWSLKAPNDLYLETKKIAGLLIETVSKGSQNQIVVGLGFNVLDKPALDIATSLSEYIEVTQEIWEGFLESFHRNLQETLPALSHTKLDAKSCEDLLEALNLNPNLQKKYLSVDPEGNLQSEDSLISWRELLD